MDAPFGFSYQKPKVNALERKQEARENWYFHIFPEILKEAALIDADVYFEDEASVMLNVTNGKTWGWKGQTPVIYRSGQRTKTTLISAVSTKGHLYYEKCDGSLNGEKYKTFLANLMDQSDKPIFIIHDGLPAHRSTLIKEFVSKQQGRIQCYQLPGYSPDLNPDEFVWAILKDV